MQYTFTTSHVLCSVFRRTRNGMMVCDTREYRFVVTMEHGRCGTNRNS
jgi:hypothetical protein